MSYFFADLPEYAAMILFGIGLSILMLAKNLVKKIIGLNIMDTSVFLFLAAKGYVEGTVAPVVTPEEIGKVLLAGAFGNYLDPSSACRIGMIPQELAGRIVPVGNAAGDGARMCSLSAAQFARCSSAAASCEFIELASLDDFQDTFVENMLF